MPALILVTGCEGSGTTLMTTELGALAGVLVGFLKPRTDLRSVWPNETAYADHAMKLAMKEIELETSKLWGIESRLGSASHAWESYLNMTHDAWGEDITDAPFGGADEAYDGLEQFVDEARCGTTGGDAPSPVVTPLLWRGDPPRQILQKIGNSLHKLVERASLTSSFPPSAIVLHRSAPFEVASSPVVQDLGAIAAATAAAARANVNATASTAISSIGVIIVVRHPADSAASQAS